MRNSIGSTRAFVKARTEGRPVAASFGGFAAGFLTLPFISRHVPVTSVIDEDDGKWLQAAKLCAELVEDDELVIHDNTTARDIIGQSLSVWASKHCAEVQVLDKFELVASLDRDAFGLDYDGEKNKQPILYVGFQSQQTTPFINVKMKIEALEAAHPWLGRTAVSIAEQASYRTFTAFTPNVAFHQASYLYWFGQETDKDFREEAGCIGDDEIGEDTLLPSQFIDSFPKYFFEGKSLERDEIQRIAQGNDGSDKTAKVILSILDLFEQDARLPYLDNFYGESAFFSCYMGSGDDMLARVMDDFYQNTASGGDYTDLYGVAEVAFNKRAFLKWKAEMEKGFALYTQLDRLMRCIGDVQ